MVSKADNKESAKCMCERVRVSEKFTFTANTWFYPGVVFCCCCVGCCCCAVSLAVLVDQNGTSIDYFIYIAGELWWMEVYLVVVFTIAYAIQTTQNRVVIG